MFEFHGWVVVQYHSDDTDSHQQEACIREVQKLLHGFDAETASIHRRNGCDSVVVTGQYNHRDDEVIDLLRLIGAVAPGAYGLLYIRDDEDERFREEVFRVWRLVRGKLTEHSDPFLSPVVPSVEDAYAPTRSD